MKRQLIALCAFLVLSLQLVAQPVLDSVAIRFGATITNAELREHLQILASDSFLGRDTGKEGQKMAAAYLKNAFIQAGIPPVTGVDPDAIIDGYFQPYKLIEERTGGLSIRSKGEEYTYKKEIAYFNEDLDGDLVVSEVTYLGDATQLPRTSIKGAVVLLAGAGMAEGGDFWSTLRSRMENIRKAEPTVVLVGVPDLQKIIGEVHLPGSNMRLDDGSQKGRNGTSRAQMILVDDSTMDRLLGRTNMAKLAKKKSGRRLPVDLLLHAAPQQQELQAENVLAFIEGSDKKAEIVVLTAHYDHIGVEDGVVYNGADDDGTGTVALLEIAAAFAAAKAAGHGPRRSVLIMPVSGEEKGLLGSRYYSEHPVFPLANTVADLNIDMIGRTDTAHTDSPPYVYVIGSDRLSTELHEANEAANSLYAKLDLDYTYNAPNDPNRFYFRSDHYNFARKGVPSIFYFSGVHEDYHQPGDDVEKIDFDLLHQRTLLVYYTAWILANQEKRIEVDKPLKP